MAQPPTSEPTADGQTGQTGSCVCGAIQLRFAPGAQPIMANLCHCATCKKSTGSAFAYMARFKADHVTYSAPADDPGALRTYADTSPESGSVLERSFCGRCGSNVRVTMRAGPSGTEVNTTEFVAVPQGVIDDDREGAGFGAEARTPTLELFCARRANWLPDIAGAKTFEKMPSAL